MCGLQSRPSLPSVGPLRSTAPLALGLIDTPSTKATSDASLSTITASDPCATQQQAQYLHQFVLHASLDAVDEAMWATKELHLKVGDQLQTRLQHGGLSGVEQQQ